MKQNSLLAVAAAASLLAASSSASAAGATRTWISGVGDDANPCSRTAPCKTWAGAISKTAAGGEIDAMDPGGFGAITITQAITLDGGGFGSILASGTNGVVVNAGLGDVVVLRNLSINGAPPGSGSIDGIRFLSGAALHVENTEVSGFGAFGINFQPATAAKLFVTDTVLRNNAAGAYMKPSGVGSANGSFDRTHFDGNAGFGLRVDAGAKATVRNSTAAGNSNNGFVAYTANAGTEADLTVESCTVSGNINIGLFSNGPASNIRLSNVTVTDNATGLLSSASGRVISFGNNRVYANTSSNGAPTATQPQM